MSETTGPEGHVHRYHATCHWTGDTNMGYESYDRAHTSSAPPASTELMLSADPAFLGHPQKLNPEQLVVVAVSSCQLLSFLAIAARARVQVLEYDDHAETRAYCTLGAIFPFPCRIRRSLQNFPSTHSGA